MVPGLWMDPSRNREWLKDKRTRGGMRLLDWTFLFPPQGINCVGKQQLKDGAFVEWTQSQMNEGTFAERNWWNSVEDGSAVTHSEFTFNYPVSIHTHCHALLNGFAHLGPPVVKPWAILKTRWNPTAVHTHSLWYKSAFFVETMKTCRRNQFIQLFKRTQTFSYFITTHFLFCSLYRIENLKVEHNCDSKFFPFCSIQFLTSFPTAWCCHHHVLQRVDGIEAQWKE